MRMSPLVSNFLYQTMVHPCLTVYAQIWNLNTNTTLNVSRVNELRDTLEMVRMLRSGEMRIIKALKRMKDDLPNPRIWGIS